MTDVQIEYVKGKTGIETMKVNGYFLHSKYDPIREANEFAKKNYRPGHVHILFGYGKGYFVEALLNEFKSNENLIVIEPILTTSGLDKEGIVFIQSNSIDEIAEEVNKYSQMFVLNNVHIICSPNYDKIFQNLYKELLIKLKERVSINRININSINKMAHEWQRNYLYNIKNAIHDHSIHVLHKYTNSPVVIASGGPSLTKQIPLLKKIRDKVLLIVSGSTVNTLLKENIEPDYVVSIDSQEVNYNHFKDLKLKHAKLIYSMFNHYKIRESFYNDAFYFVQKNEKALASHLNNIVHTKVEGIYGGESVANYAFTIANYISSGPIALIGQDLAYTDNKSHAENNKHFKMITEEDIIKRGMFYTEGYYGDKVLTDSAFLAMKESFERLIKTIPVNENIFNCTEGGAKIHHFKQIPFKQFIETFVTDHISTESYKKEIIEVNNNEIIQLFNNELEILKKIKRLVVENLSLISSNKYNTHFSENILKKMDRNDKEIEEKRNKTSLQVIMGPLNIAILKNYTPKNNETPQEAYSRVVEQNRALYNGYLEAIEITQQYIENLCEHLKIEGERNR